jgi:septum site-determining protein MinC
VDERVFFDSVLSQLDKKLAASHNFFSGAEVDIYIGNRILSPEEINLVKDIVEKKYNLRIRGFIENVEDADEKGEKIEGSPRRLATRIERKRNKKVFSKLTDPLLQQEEDTLFLRKTIRSGQNIEYHGNIVVLGDVNPGSYLIAGGDIIVLGRLRGVAHAGAQGSEGAVVIALQLSPSQLRIAQYIGRSPDNEIQTIQKAEKAYVRDGEVVIESIL